MKNSGTKPVSRSKRSPEWRAVKSKALRSLAPNIFTWFIGLGVTARRRQKEKDSERERQGKKDHKTPARKTTATQCNTLQHIATHGNTLQHIAAQCSTLQQLKTIRRQQGRQVRNTRPYTTVSSASLRSCNRRGLARHTATHCNRWGRATPYNMCCNTTHHETRETMQNERPSVATW